ncbi:MAG: polysaccharide deacetylase family protein [Bacteroidetes bacterium]|nr:polysaccharide deacetylase family protein [Bacteroidota bacterium]
MTVLEIIIPVLFFLALVYLTIEYSLLIPPGKGLPVLMYHNISEGKADGLNIPYSELELQFMYLKEKGYNSISLNQLSALINGGDRLPKRSFLLTFDDAYVSLEDKLIPLLERYDFSAVVFVPVAFIGKSNLWDDGGIPVMSAESLQKAAQNPHIEIGLHSFLHRSYNEMNSDDIREDLGNCRQSLEYYKIPYFGALAYPYGAYPKKDLIFKKEMFGVLSESVIALAFRIGNRLNPFPLAQKYEVKRIDIRGTDSFFIFKTKLRKGRAKIFA